MLEPHLLIPILVFAAVMAVGGAALAIRGGRQRAVHERLFGHRESATATATTHSPEQWLEQTLERVGRPMVKQESAGQLRRRLLQAGYYHDSAPAIFLASQLCLLLAGLVVCVPILLQLDLPVMVRLFVGLVGVSSFALLPNLVVRARQHKRTKEVNHHLPDAIDLLEICVSAGTGLDMAWNAVSDQIRGVSPMLADEMALTNLEIQLGSKRETAMRNMAERTGAADLNSFVAVLVQSERFGVSIGQTLRNYAASLRAERSQRAEEAGEKLAIKLLFPMLLFIFPVLFLVILGPALIQVAEVFRNF